MCTLVYLLHKKHFSKEYDGFERMYVVCSMILTDVRFLRI